VLKSRLTQWIRHVRQLALVPARIHALERRFPTCVFYEGASVDAASFLGGFNVVFGQVSVSQSSVGSHTFIQRHSSVHMATIGRFCSIAPNVHIGLGQHPVDQVSTHPAFYATAQPLARTFATRDSFEPFAPVTIGHDVWIGQNVLVNGGVTIGTGAVIAAQAVVTKDVPPYAIVGGVPARVIRHRFSEAVVAQLTASVWWEQSDEWLSAHQHLFANPEQFLAAMHTARQGQ
jgi:acetyltransferase-like isoleucine patch superfamily enzyme